MALRRPDPEWIEAREGGLLVGMVNPDAREKVGRAKVDSRRASDVLDNQGLGGSNLPDHLLSILCRPKTCLDLIGGLGRIEGSSRPFPPIERDGVPIGLSDCL